MTNYQAIVKENAEKSYAALRKVVARQDISTEMPPLIGTLINLLDKENININGDCFFRYLSCTASEQMVVEIGFPIEKTDSQSESIEFSSFPAGKYLSVIHSGDYKNLGDAHMYLEDFSKSNNFTLDESKTDMGVKWGCRVEFYITEPDVTPIEEWKTEVLFLLK
ncbi:effector-binding domain-containing protein [Pedobacter sp. UYP30]|uniref:GyrI-like domain-containing protein n=1 Tax=Pedobacter sp. UYP30 TaxID=1756400 RepID=UPI0033923DE8